MSANPDKTIRLTPICRISIGGDTGGKTIRLGIATEAITLDHERVFNSVANSLTESQARNMLKALDDIKAELYRRLSVGPDSPDHHTCPTCGARAFLGKTDGVPCPDCAAAEEAWKVRNRLNV